VDPTGIFGTSEVRARVPQKQGLKLGGPYRNFRHLRVRARVPQKQGLKPNEEFILQDEYNCPGASSTKTRIETCGHKQLRVGRIVRARVPQKQGLKQRDLVHLDLLLSMSGREFHKNKD